MEKLRQKILDYWKKHSDSLQALGLILGRSGAVLFLSYMAASTTSSFLIRFVSGAAIQAGRVMPPRVEQPNFRKEINFREVRKDVVRRNLFNSSGELPDESGPIVSEASQAAEFNANAPCGKSSLPLELLGIIYSPKAGSSLATIKERGYSIADIYREGDGIIGQEQAMVFLVEPGRVVLNNNGNKECLEIKTVKAGGFASSSSQSSSSEPKPDSENTDANATVLLKSSFVEEALGPGFAKILESGRLVPYNKDGSMIGFKLIGVKGQSLWKKAGLNNGDVITSVNGQSMAQPDKGFAFYEALQSEREIRLEFLRKGKSPTNISIEIK